MTLRTLQVTWCDDIRFEIGNKPSFMGVYTGGMVLASLPTTLDRLSVWFSAASPLEEPFTRFSIRVVRDDGVVILQMPEVVVAAAEAGTIPDGRTHAVLAAALNLGRVEFPEGCKYLQAIATTESGEVSSAKLWVDVNPQLLVSYGVPVPSPL